MPKNVCSWLVALFALRWDDENLIINIDHAIVKMNRS
jgi:hypothetical protein